MALENTILIVSSSQDLHGLLVAKELRKKGIQVSYLEIDNMEKYKLNWCLNQPPKSTITFPDGEVIKIDSIPVIWWRRTFSRQNVIDEAEEKKKNCSYSNFINKSWPISIRNALMASHTGKWISRPDATEQASDKIMQLKLARKVGFSVPETIISNNPEEVRRFEKRHPNGIIIKPLVSTEKILWTLKTDTSTLTDESIQACPSIYQEYITGTKHLRINCFGEYCFAAQIETADVDWRPNLNVPITSYELSTDFKLKLRKILADLNLEMGIFDFKISEDGTPVWFEVNPQGQWLFLEPLTNQQLLKHFTDYILNEISSIGTQVKLQNVS